jgi:hypothetical protein
VGCFVSASAALLFALLSKRLIRSIALTRATQIRLYVDAKTGRRALRKYWKTRVLREISRCTR